MKELKIWAERWIEKSKKNYIGGEWSIGSGENLCINENPASEKKLCEWKNSSLSDVNHAVEKAQNAFAQKSWLAYPMRQRAKIMRDIGSIIKQHEKELAMLESIANGKTYKEALHDDLPDCSEIFNYYAGWIDKIYGESIPVENNFINFTRKEALGVCALIVPWNFPLLMACWKIAPALATGNSIILKPSEYTPFSLIRLFELLDQNLNLPSGLMNLILGDGQVGEYLSSHPSIHKISFTGSTAVGKKIVEQSAKSNLKSLSLELGGKSPNIIFADCPNLEQAIERSFHVMFSHKGEKCSEPTRFYVQSSIYEQVIESLAQKANKIKCGNPLLEDTDQGPQCHKQHFEKIKMYMESGKKEGAELICGGNVDTNANQGKGYYIRPTIFTKTKPHMTIVQEEIFGPVLCVDSFDSEDEVIHLANSTKYGLAAGVWTENISRAHRIAQEIDTGMVFINRYGCYDFSSPFGGFRESGWGKDMAIHSIEAYTKTKSIWVHL